MSKLSTPLQYSSEFGKLNDLRPLQVVNSVKRVIAIPFASGSVLSADRGVNGYTARGTEQGCLLCSDYVAKTYRSLLGYTASYYTDFNYDVLPLPYECLQIQPFISDWVTLFQWVDYDTHLVIKDLSPTGISYITAKLTRICFKSIVTFGGALSWIVNGIK